MKARNLYLILLLFVTATIANAQIFLPAPLKINENVENLFLDASTWYHAAGPSDGKGLLFPVVDLRDFVFSMTHEDGGATIPTYFDGMIVYNNGTGETPTGPYLGKASKVAPGFYYFYNPQGAETKSVTNGEWLPLGTGGTGGGGSNGLKVKVLPEDERDALTSGASPTEKQELIGTVIYNTESSQLEIWLGDSWLPLNKSEENEENETNGYVTFPDVLLNAKYFFYEGTMSFSQCFNISGSILSDTEYTLITAKPQYKNNAWWGGVANSSQATRWSNGQKTTVAQSSSHCRCVRKYPAD